jgi:hypothetical protein
MAAPLGHELAGLAPGRAFDNFSGRGALVLSREWLAMVFGWINVRAILVDLLLVGPLLILAEGLRWRRGR